MNLASRTLMDRPNGSAVAERVSPAESGVADAALFAYLCPDWAEPALIVAEPGFSVIHANAPFHALFAQADLARLTGGRLRFGPKGFDRRFGAMLERVFSLDLDRAHLSAMIDDRPLTLILRMIPPGLIPGTGARYARIELRQPDQGPPRAALVSLAETFGLSSEERRVLGLFLTGQSVEEIGKSTGQPVADTRQAMKSILAKTGCQRQAQLALLFAGLTR